MSYRVKEIRSTLGAAQRLLGELEKSESSKPSNALNVAVGLPLLAVLYSIFVGF